MAGTSPAMTLRVGAASSAALAHPFALHGALSAAGAEIQHQMLPTGHNLSQTDLQLLVRWFGR